MDNRSNYMNNRSAQALYLVITLLALYLSIKRNNGIDIGSFLVAFIFPYIYIIYYLATESNRNTISM